MTERGLTPRNADDYLALQQNLLPPGLAWNRSPDSRLTAVLGAAAEELARLDEAARLLPEEVTPLTTVNGINDWERVLGLPDQCLPSGSTLQERRNAVLMRLRDSGRQDLAYWYELAGTLGFEVTIEENWPFILGWHELGDPVGGWSEESGLAPERWEQEYAHPIGRLGEEDIRYWLNVIVHGALLLRFRLGESLLPEPLLDWREAQSLRCVMSSTIEAHLLLTFEYRDE